MNLSLLDGEDRQFLARLSDLHHISEAKQIARFTAFCNERQGMIAQEYARQTGAKFLLYGGYACAERKVAGFFPPWQDPEEDAFPIQAITLHLPRGANLTHRDYLGSLMSLGLARESIGDIVQSQRNCVLFVMESVASVILDELRKVGGVGVKPEPGTVDFEPPVPQFQELRGTVPSLRLDCIVRLLTGAAREKSADLIRGELVTVNHQLADSVSRTCGQGDIITIRGYGKFKVSEIGPPTKKGRLPVVCLKYQ